MRRDDRHLRQLHNLPERIVRDVGDVDHDAESVHLGDDLSPERRQSFVGAALVV